MAFVFIVSIYNFAGGHGSDCKYADIIQKKKCTYIKDENRSAFVTTFWLDISYCCVIVELKYCYVHVCRRSAEVSI